MATEGSPPTRDVDAWLTRALNDGTQPVRSLCVS